MSSRSGAWKRHHTPRGIASRSVGAPKPPVEKPLLNLCVGVGDEPAAQILLHHGQTEVVEFERGPQAVRNAGIADLVHTTF